MCGIIGFQGTFSRESLALGLRAIRHRGPDDSGVFLSPENAVGLGHARLSIIDLSPLGHQPMPDATGTVQLVFNGEIYNYRELRRDLESRGHVFRGTSDTEVLLHMYLDEGRAMLPRLNGIFALAIWDARARKLLLARDALGVKPLYVSEGDSGFAFCSEVKGLLQLVPDARRLDEAALHRYLTFLWCPGAGTPLEGIRKVFPGESLEIVSGRIVRRETWYRLPMFRGVKPDLDEDSAVRGTESALRTAVHRQMVADVPVGAFLSGGLDSSAIVSFAREVNPDIRCFTIEQVGGADEGDADDLPYARRVADHLKVPLEVVRVDSERMAGDLELMVWQLDEPLADPATLNVLYISQLARQQGIKVLLSGAGGDDLFTGYRRHRALQSEYLWSWLPFPALAAIEGTTSRLDQRRPTGRRVAKLFRGASLEGDERITSYFEWVRSRDLFALYTPEFRERVGSSPASQPMIEFLAGLPPRVRRLNRMLALEQRFFLSDHNLNYTDKMSMAVGVEARVPFLDLDLVDFAERIPSNFRQRGAVGKWVLKRAMEPYLPQDIIYRPKSGFMAPLRRWLRSELRPLVGEVLGRDSLKRRGLFRPEAVAALVQANLEGRVDANYTVFSLLCIELWCRTYIDRSPVR
jgi:asparagine synthase (glutamine-hydrolysing)